jgi:hypothetical protein
MAMMIISTGLLLVVLLELVRNQVKQETHTRANEHRDRVRRAGGISSRHLHGRFSGQKRKPNARIARHKLYAT